MAEIAAAARCSIGLVRSFNTIGNLAKSGILSDNTRSAIEAQKS
jgi:hypothetical protein